MPNAHLAAGLAVLEELYDGLVALLRPLDEGCLGWTPVEGANTIAAMVWHTVGSTDSWLARAVGETIVRDRDAEFRRPGTAVELVAAIERSRAEARRRFERLATIDPAAERAVRRLSANRELTVTAAWCVEHALIHAGEHWGQIQLTRQLYASRA